MNDQGLLNIFGNCNIRSIRKDKKINVVIKLKKDNPIIGAKIIFVLRLPVATR
jgi:hypothetical protein